MGEGSWIGLDVHARSTVAAVISGESGEVVVCRAPVGVDELAGWVRAFPGPVRAAYEAGPTGFGLSRALDPPHTPHAPAPDETAPTRRAHPPPPAHDTPPPHPTPH